ncbi:hypothetical protein KAR48_06325 [bacterium]|nr:hypothetical protein [bacterium]
MQAEVLGHQFRYAWVDEPGFSPTHMWGATFDLRKKIAFQKVDRVEEQLNKSQVELQKALLGLKSLKKDGLQIKGRKGRKSTLPPKSSLTDLLERRKKLLPNPENIPPQIPESSDEVEVVEDIEFPENFYTYKNMYYRASDLKQIADDLQIQILEAQKDKIWGFQSVEPWEPPGVNSGQDVLESWELTLGQVGRSLFDINNDNRPDYVVADESSWDDGWSVFYNNGNGFSQDAVWSFSPILKTYLGGVTDDLAYSSGKKTIRTVRDMTGDGYPDLVFIHDNNWKVALNIGMNHSGFGDVIDWEWDKSSEYPFIAYAEQRKTTGGDESHGNEWIADTFDINGDNIPDFIYAQKNNNTIWWDVYLGYYNESTNKGGFSNQKRAWQFNGINNFNHEFFYQFHDASYYGALCRHERSKFMEITKDMNGDGRPDHLFAISNKGCWVAYNNGSGFDFPQKWNNFPEDTWLAKRNSDKENRCFTISLYPLDYTSLLSIVYDLVDMNGDNLPDLIKANASGDGWMVWLNIGGGFDHPKIFSTTSDLKELHRIKIEKLLGIPTAALKQVWLLDMNGDYLSDIIDASKGEVWEVYLNNSGGEETLTALMNKQKVREIQAKLAEANEYFFHEEYVLSVIAYKDADQKICDYLNIGNQVPPNMELDQPDTVVDSADKNTQSVMRNPWAIKRIMHGMSKMGDKAVDEISGVLELPALLQLPESQQLPSGVLDNVINNQCLDRITEINLCNLILEEEDCKSPLRFASNLIYIHEFVIPLCIADANFKLNNYEIAEIFYGQASQFICLNRLIETRVLWLKYAKLYLAWANELYKRSYRDPDEKILRDSARALYTYIMESDFPLFEKCKDAEKLRFEMLSIFEFLESANEYLSAKIDAISVTTGSISLEEQLNTSLFENEGHEDKYSLQGAKMVLKSLSLNDFADMDKMFEATNPMMLVYHIEALSNMLKLNSEYHINYLGYTDQILPIWRYNYLQNVTKDFVQHAIQLEREYMNFRISAENETYSQNQLVQSVGLNKFNQLVEKYKVEQAAWNTVISKMNKKTAEIQREAAKAQIEAINNQMSRGVVNIASSMISGGISGGVIGVIAGMANGIANDMETQAYLGDQKTLARYAYQQAQLAEQAAGLQINVSKINQQIAALQGDLAVLQLSYAQNNLDYLQNKEFNAELWYKLASSVKALSQSYLNSAIELGLLMEHAYNFETGRNIHKIRLDYSHNELSGLLAGDYLLRDIESFEYDRAVNIQQKEIPVKHVISLASSRPMQFFQFLDSDTLCFATTLGEVARAYPGAYNCRIKNVELIIEGLLPATGIHGTFSNGIYSMVRLPITSEVSSDQLSNENNRWRVHGAYYDTLKTHETETMLLSNYSIREDRMVFSPPPEQLSLFENTGVATEWTLHIPRSTNNFDLHTISDVKFVITFTSQFDPQLASLVSHEYISYRNANPDSFAVMKMFSARYQYPDEFYYFTNDEESDTLELHFPISRYAFPLNEEDFKCRDASVVFFPPDSLPEGAIDVTLIWNDGKDSYNQTGSIQKTADEDNGILSFENGFWGDRNKETPVAEWVVRFIREPDGESGWKWSPESLLDVWLAIEYSSKLRTP